MLNSNVFIPYIYLLKTVLIVLIIIFIFLDFDSQDLGGSSVLDSDYLTMLSSSDKLMSGEFEALERLQAELDLFDDPNRPEEIVEQMDVENHIELIEEEVCSDSGDAMISEVTQNIKIEIEESESEHETSVQLQAKPQLVQHIKQEAIDSESENEVVTLKQFQPHSQSEIVTVGGSNAIKRSAPSSLHGNQQPKKSVR